MRETENGFVLVFRKCNLQLKFVLRDEIKAN